MLSTGRENQVRELLIQLLKPIAEGFSSPITAHLAPFLMTSFISFWNMVESIVQEAIFARESRHKELK
jgi:hypothetical protein